MSEWNSVLDKLPAQQGNYLCYSPKWKAHIKVLLFSRHTVGSRLRFWHGGLESKSITHWQELPEFPKESE